MPMQLCLVRSLGTLGIPCFARYAGDAHSSLRFDAMKRAMIRASGGAPNRMQTSNESSVNGGGLTEQCN